MLFTGGTFRNFFVSIVLIMFLVVSVAGIAAIDSEMSTNGVAASPCPFMPGMSSLCQANPLQHMVAWQSMFFATHSQNDLMALLLLLGALFVIGARLMRHAAYPALIRATRPVSVYQRLRTAFPGPLQEALADGILHPKVYG